MKDEKYLKEEGIVLKISDVKDDDQIISILTKNNGKIALYAKGIKKSTSKLKQAGILGTYQSFEAVYGKTMWTLTGVKLNQPISKWHTDLFGLTIITQLCEIMDKVSYQDEEIDEMYFLLMQKTLNWFNFANPWVLGKYFEWHMLDLLGYGSEIEICTSCGEAFNRSRWRSAASIYGGFYCKNCLDEVDRSSLIYFGEEDNGFLRFLETANEKNIAVYYPSSNLKKKMDVYFKKVWEYIFDFSLSTYRFSDKVRYQ